MSLFQKMKTPVEQIVRAQSSLMTPFPKKRVLTSTLIILLSLGISHFLNPVQGTPAWSSPVLVDTHSGLDILPNALQTSNGTLWVAWQSTRNNQTTGRTDIIYKTYTNGVWSSDLNLTSSGWNSGPSLIQLANGTILAFWSIKSGGSYLVYSSLTNGRSWSSPTPITTTTLNDTLASATVGLDGTIWLVWTRVDSTNPSVPALKQLFYKTWRSGVWSPESQLTNDSNQNFGPDIIVGKDGIVRVLWSKGAAGSNYQIFSKTFNGNAWTLDKQNVTSSSTDEHPSMLQDRNGTLWLFWGRLIVVSQLIQYFILFGKYSYDMGKTWSGEIQLTPTPGTKIFDSFMPNAVQTNFGVKSIWILYCSNYNVPDYDIFALQSTGIGSVHDVAVTGIAAYSSFGTSWEYPGGFKAVGQSSIVTIKVNITDIGDFVESVFATLSLTNTSITSLNTLHKLIGPGSTATFYWYWNTTGVKPARYGVSVSIIPLTGESQGNMGDNSYSKTNQVHILPFGDVDQDGSVTITDITVFTYGFNSSPSCNCNRWNPYADIANDGVIDIIDVTIAGANFNTFA